MEDTVLKKTRQEIYDSLWSIGSTKTAKEYGIPYAYFKAQIAAANIETPSSSYWTNLSMGRNPEKIPLLGNGEEVIELHTLSEYQRKRKEKKEYFSPTLIKKDAPGNPMPALNPAQLFTAKKPADDFEYGYQFKELETVKGYGGTYNIYRRERLYEEVWNRPMLDVAKHYKVSDNTIRSICKEMSIPYPRAGYWNKVRAGQKVEQEPLPPKGPEMRRGVQNPNYIDTDEKLATDNLEFMSEDRRLIIANVATDTHMPSDTDKIPKVIKEGVNACDDISKDSAKRAAKIVTALYNTLKPLGCDVGPHLCFTIDGEKVNIHLSEAQDRLDHKPTKEENMRMLRYEEERRKYSWASKPNIRKYDYEYNGKLTLSCGRRNWRDGANSVIEERLPSIIIALYAEAERVRKDRLAKEEEERKRQEEERRKKEAIQKYNNEVDRTIELINKAEDFQIACKVRTYIEAMKTAHQNEDISEWIEWASKKADWFDPSANYEDEILGKRDHGKGPESKKLDYKYSYFYI